MTLLLKNIISKLKYKSNKTLKKCEKFKGINKMRNEDKRTGERNYYDQKWSKVP
jgi:hypothetical protein